MIAVIFKALRIIFRRQIDTFEGYIAGCLVRAAGIYMGIY
jgi:hypothetical protein